MAGVSPTDGVWVRWPTSGVNHWCLAPVIHPPAGWGLVPGAAMRGSGGRRGRCAGAGGELDPLVGRVVERAARPQAVDRGDAPSPTSSSRPTPRRRAARRSSRPSSRGDLPASSRPARRRAASAARCRGRRSRRSRRRGRSGARARPAHSSRSAGSDERMSIVARACPGTVLAASPPATVVTTEVISGRPCGQRLDADDLARRAPRPRCGRGRCPRRRAPGRPVSSSVRHTAPLRADTRSPFSRAHSNTSAAARRSAACSATAGARSRTSSSAQISSRTSGNGQAARRRAAPSPSRPAPGRPSCRRRPGPVQRSPDDGERPRGDLAERRNTVSVWPSSATVPGAVAGQRHHHAAGGPVRLVHPLRWCSRAAPATRRSRPPPAPARTPSDGESIATSRDSRWTNVSVSSAPGIGVVCRTAVWLRCGYGCRASSLVHPCRRTRRRRLPAEHGLQRRRGGRARGRHLRAAADAQGAGDRRPRDLQHRRGAGAERAARGRRRGAADAGARALSQEGRARAGRTLAGVGWRRRTPSPRSTRRPALLTLVDREAAREPTRGAV